MFPVSDVSVCINETLSGDWCTANGEESADDVPEVDISFNITLDMDNISSLLIVCVEQIKSVVSVDLRIVEEWVQYRGEFMAAIMAVFYSSHDVVRADWELLCS